MQNDLDKTQIGEIYSKLELVHFHKFLCSTI